MNIDTQLQNESKQSIIKKFVLGVGAFFLCASVLVGLGAIALSSHQSNVVKTNALDINEYDGNIYYDSESYDKDIYLGFDFSSLTSQDLQDTYVYFDGAICHFEDFDTDYFYYYDDDEAYPSFYYASFWNEQIDYWHFPQLANYLNSAKVTLTPSESNQNHYDYLANYLNSLDVDERTTLVNSGLYVIYNNEYYFIDDFSHEDGLYFANTNDYYVVFDLDSSSSYYGAFYCNTETEFHLSFDYNLEIYSFDIKSNMYAPNNPTGILETLVTLLTGGITGLSGGIGTGVSGLVNAIFVTDGHLSVFAGAIIIFAGISLAIGLCRWVMNFLTSLGAKK